MVESERIRKITKARNWANPLEGSTDKVIKYIYDLNKFSRWRILTLMIRIALIAKFCENMHPS
jgi:hypothetical protein